MLWNTLTALKSWNREWNAPLNLYVNLLLYFCYFLDALLCQVPVCWYLTSRKGVLIKTKTNKFCYHIPLHPYYLHGSTAVVSPPPRQFSGFHPPSSPLRFCYFPALTHFPTATKFFSLYASGKVPPYPSPKPTSTLTYHLGQNVGLGEG